MITSFLITFLLTFRVILYAGILGKLKMQDGLHLTLFVDSLRLFVAAAYITLHCIFDASGVSSLSLPMSHLPISHPPNKLVDVQRSTPLYPRIC